MCFEEILSNLDSDIPHTNSNSYLAFRERTFDYNKSLGGKLMDPANLNELTDSLTILEWQIFKDL